MRHTFFGKVKEGKIQFENREKFFDFLSLLEGEPIQLLVEKVRTKRTLPQNAYYHGVIVKMIADEVGYANPDEVHQALKMMFLKKFIGKQQIPTVRSTTDLDTLEFEDYLEKVRTWAGETLNMRIPLPNEITLEVENELKLEVDEANQDKQSKQAGNSEVKEKT